MNKKLIVCFFCLLGIPSFFIGCQKNEPENKLKAKSETIYLNVNAPSGLSLRSQAGKNFSKVGVIPHGSVVILLNKNGPVETIEGQTTNWIKIRFQGMEGWIFGGFTTPLTKESSSNNGQTSKINRPIVLNDKLKNFIKFGHGFKIQANSSATEIENFFGTPLALLIEKEEKAPEKRFYSYSHKKIVIFQTEKNSEIKELTLYQKDNEFLTHAYMRKTMQTIKNDFGEPIKIIKIEKFLKNKKYFGTKFIYTLPRTEISPQTFSYLEIEFLNNIVEKISWKR